MREPPRLLRCIFNALLLVLFVVACSLIGIIVAILLGWVVVR